MTEPARHLFLVGMMGVGKTTIGKRVAKRLGRVHVDCDRYIETEAGRTIPEIFADDGEPAFRALEHEALRALCDDPRELVVSTGGGAVLSAANRELLRSAGTVVWLRAKPDTIVKRVHGGKGRPLLADNPRANVLRLLKERTALYQDACHFAVDVDGRSAEKVTAEVIERATAERSPS